VSAFSHPSKQQPLDNDTTRSRTHDHDGKSTVTPPSYVYRFSFHSCIVAHGIFSVFWSFIVLCFIYSITKYQIITNSW